MTMQARLAATLGILIILIGTHWYAYQAGGRNHTAALKLEYAQQAKVADAAARAKEQEYSRQLKKAQDDYVRRQNRLLADASAARAESSRLQHSLADFRRQLPDLTEQAVRQYADTASIVLNECQDRYTAVAEDADRLGNAAQALDQAWPK